MALKIRIRAEDKPDGRESLGSYACIRWRRAVAEPSGSGENERLCDRARELTSKGRFA